jgi:hypothetical protein
LAIGLGGSRGTCAVVLEHRTKLLAKFGRILVSVHGAGVQPLVIHGRSLAPDAEFTLPLGTTPIRPQERWTPGAFQTMDARR